VLFRSDEEIVNLKNLTKRARDASATNDIIQKGKELLDDMEWQRRKVEMEYRYFYHRLNALNLINHDAI
jgi:hypothetical protein